MQNSGITGDTAAYNCKENNFDGAVKSLHQLWFSN